VPIVTRSEEVADILKEARTIAVLGAHGERWRAACYVPEYLHAHGYRVLPVNPLLAGQRLWGEPVRARLADLDEPVDIVDVFRRPEALPAHLDDVLAMQPPPRVVWLQSGIRHEDFARRLSDAGITVVQDRCTMAEHQNYF
jgi:predicted CoA-binding protein